LSHTYSFEQYKAEHGKHYSCPKEHALRKGMFEENLKKIMHHNLHGDASWKMGVNKFTDMSPEEINRMKGYNRGQGAHQKENKLAGHVEVKRVLKEVTDLPRHVDWREAGIASPVKNQGHCGRYYLYSQHSPLVVC
jgi:cathepsin L